MAAPNDTADREFDVVVYGASGFTGKLVVEYLGSRYPSSAELSWAVAGRNEQKLVAVLAELGLSPEQIPVLVADSADGAALGAIASRARVVLTTVGPYASYGSKLVAACVENGTSYCDLAGEVQWMRRMIDRHQRGAEASGARIVHACGFDSIPSDIGVWYLQRESAERFGAPCRDVSLVVRSMRGGVSGGTAASLLNAVEEGRRDREVARILTHPYSLNPEGQREGPDGRDQTGVAYNEQLGVWTCPFVMALINTRVVRRSNALLDYPYGRDFRYNEATMTGPGVAGRLKAMAATTAFRGFMAASAIDLTRNLLVKPLLPDQGKGPGKEDRENGYFNLVIVGKTAADDAIRVRVTGDRDPGYGSTSKMIAESAVCLARDELTVGGGFWTPASAMADPLIARLRRSAGVQFDVH